MGLSLVLPLNAAAWGHDEGKIAAAPEHVQRTEPSGAPSTPPAQPAGDMPGPPAPGAAKPSASDRSAEPAPSQELSAPTQVSQPQASATEAAQPLTAEVMEVGGQAHWAAAGVSAATDEGWTPLKKGDRLSAGVQIRTSLRSFVQISFEGRHFVAIERATVAAVEAFHRTATDETVRIGLGYGTLRGGSTEGTLRANFEVVSPVATMAKRGTDGWEISVEPFTGAYRIALARYGLVEAIQQARAGRRFSRLVRPGEYATPQNIASMWLRQDVFDRVVPIHDAAGLTPADARFAAAHPTGIGVVAPGAGADVEHYTGRAVRLIDRPAPSAVRSVPLPGAPVLRPEGNFGVRGAGN